MALYIPASTRRRRTAVIAVVAVVVGLLVGLLIGRLLAPSIDDTVRSKQGQVSDLTARLDGLGLEYQQQAGGAAGAADARRGAIDAARGIVADTTTVVEDMPWVSPTERAKATAAVRSVQAAVEQGVPPAQLTLAIAAAETVLRDASGAAAPAA